MSNGADVGDLKNSLSPWVFEHLGEKLIMMDAVNQLLDSPREDPLEESPARDDSFVCMGDPGMDTSSPL